MVLECITAGCHQKLYLYPFILHVSFKMLPKINSLHKPDPVKYIKFCTLQRNLEAMNDSEINSSMTKKSVKLRLNCRSFTQEKVQKCK